VLDSSGKPVLRRHSATHHGGGIVPSNGSVGEFGVVLDADGNAVLEADGKPLQITDPRVPAGGSIGKGGVILTKEGHPVLDPSGQPMIAGDTVHHGGGIIPPGGSIGAGGVVLDANGSPVLDGATGRHLRITDPRVPPGGTIGPGGILFDEQEKPMIGRDGKPLRANPIFVLREVHLGGGADGGGAAASDGAGGLKRSQWLKKARQSRVVPAGRMVTLSRMRCKDVPDVDLRGGPENISDPYLILAVLDGHGVTMDEARTAHINNVRHPRWRETCRLFIPDDAQPSSSKTAPIRLHVTLMDYNAKKPDVFIGEVTIPLEVGEGRVKAEVISRCVSPLRPHVYFHYEATPQMWFEEVEWARVMAEGVDDDDDDE